MQSTKDSRIKKRGDVYYAWYMRAKVRVRGSLYTSNFTTAKKLCDRIDALIADGRDWKLFLKGEDYEDVKKKESLIGNLYPKYIDDKKKGINQTREGIPRDRTIRLIEDTFRLWLLPFFESHQVSKVDSELWKEFVEDLIERTATDEKPDGMKLSNPRKYFKNFLGWARITGQISSLPAIYDHDAYIKSKKQESGDDESDEAYSPDKVYTNEFLDFCINNSTGNFTFFFKLLIYTGMRKSEVTQLPKNQVIFDGQKVGIKLKAKDVKTKKARFVPIPEAIVPDLKNHMDQNAAGPYLFPNAKTPKKPMHRDGFSNQWARLKRDYGLEKGKIHWTRYTYLTNAFSQKRANYAMICQAAGLSIEIAEKVYLNFKEESLHDVVSDFDYSFEVNQ